MKKLFLILIFLLSLNTVIAGTGYGFVKLEIINQPPQIKSITFLPSEAYEDSVLECKADVWDETPEKVILNYKWYNNNILLEMKSNKLQNSFIADDIIRCEIIPNDGVSDGEMKFAEIKIKPAPLTSRMLKGTLNLIGSDVNLEKTTALQSQGMLSVTGFAVNQLNTNRMASCFLE